MKKFLLRVLLFGSILFFLLVIGILLPTTPRASTSYLFAKKSKDALLASVESPRIIFIGGSNLSFGLNSQMIKDSLGLNPINTGVQIGIGLIYMMRSVLPFIQNGDIVVVAYEYHGFYGGLGYGEDALLRTILDVVPNDLKVLSIQQIIRLIKYLPQYSFSKLKPTEYSKKYIEKKRDIFNEVTSFNSYGDVFTHWNYGTKKIPPASMISGKFNYSLLNALIRFSIQLQKKGATLYITFPPYQATSFDNSMEQIKKIEAELKGTDLIVLGTPEEYKFADSLMFDTPYHLSGTGVNQRTQFLINDLRTVIDNKK